MKLGRCNNASKSRIEVLVIHYWSSCCLLHVLGFHSSISHFILLFWICILFYIIIPIPLVSIVIHFLFLCQSCMEILLWLIFCVDHISRFLTLVAMCHITIDFLCWSGMSHLDSWIPILFLFLLSNCEMDLGLCSFFLRFLSYNFFSFILIHVLCLTSCFLGICKCIEF